MIDLIFRLLKMKRTTFLKKFQFFDHFLKKKMSKISLFFGKTKIYVVIWFGGGSVVRPNLTEPPSSAEPNPNQNGSVVHYKASFQSSRL